MPLRRFSLLMFAAALGLSPAVQAGLLGTQVSVNLSSPNGVLGDATPVDLSNLVTVASTAPQIAAGDGTPIGGFMLPGESISFGDSFVDVVVASGGVTNGSGEIVAGYASGGGYTFSGMAPFANQVISSMSILYTGGSVANPGLASQWLSALTPTSFRFDLSQMTFAATAGNSGLYGDFRIALNFAPAPVPEPQAVVLLLAGGALLALALRRAR